MSLGHCEPKSNLALHSTSLLWFFWETCGYFCPSLFALQCCYERGNAITGFSSTVISLRPFLHCFIQIEKFLLSTLWGGNYWAWFRVCAEVKIVFMWEVLKESVGHIGEPWSLRGRCTGSFYQKDQFPFSHDVLRCAFQCIFAISGVVWGLRCFG